MALLPADVPWPRHPNAEWRDTLRVAREHGWYFRPLKGHPFGKLQCREALPGQRCEQVIYTTGSSTENVARSTREMIDRCPHTVDLSESLDGAPASLAQIESKINKAEHLVKAAAACLQEDSFRVRCEELLREAEADVEHCEELLDRATVAERDAADASGRRLKHLGAAGRSGEEQIGVGTIVDEAEQLVDSTASMLNGVAPSSSRDRLRSRIEAVRQDVSQLRNILRT